MLASYYPSKNSDELTMRGTVAYSLITFGVLTYIISKYWKKQQVMATAINTAITTSVPFVINPDIYNDPQQAKREHDRLRALHNVPVKAPLPVVTNYYVHPGPLRDEGPSAPYEAVNFGMDKERNVDSIDPESYLYMPLESEGITHQNAHLYKDLEEDVAIPSLRFKFIRFQFTRPRSEKESTISIGGIAFFIGRAPIKEVSTVIWNPHTGEKTPYRGQPWSDSDTWSLILAFLEPISLNRYEITTNTERPDTDPDGWKVEGSYAGTYWMLLDDRTDVAFPRMRGHVVSYFMEDKPSSA